MLTFLELYQTLLGFVFFKLYTDVGLVYPPPLDVKKQEAAAGVGAFSLQESSQASTSAAIKGPVVFDGKTVSGKDVRQTIKALADAAPATDEDADMPVVEAAPAEAEEEFVSRPSVTNPDETAALPTLQSLSSLPQSLAPKLFVPYTFWLSRETSRPIFEFLVRSFGGRIGWPASSGAGSPFGEDDESITHVIIDRPLVDRPNEAEGERLRRLRRKHVQPQWLVDCINAGKILLEDAYAQGKTLPPHLSPFGGIEGAYDPLAADAVDVGMEAEEESEEEEAEEEMAEDGTPTPEDQALKSAAAAVAAAVDEAALRAAELEAEAAGVDYGAFEKEVAKSKKATKKAKATAGAADHAEGEEDMNKMMMSNRQRKQYERAKFNEQKQAAEVRGAVGDFVLIGLLMTVLC
jgi:pescadillo protein